MKQVEFLAVLAGQKIYIISYLVTSSIPLLWFKLAIAKESVVLDLPENKGNILGK